MQLWAQSGTITGQVLGVDEKPTDFRGAFRIGPVPSGSQKLEVSYLGYITTVIDVEVRADDSVELEVLMEPEQRLRTSVTVTAEPYLESMERALNEQKTSINIKNIVSADQIGRFPDPNAAEATQRISGITLQRDQGEGRFVLVRGTEPRLSSAAINGEQIPAPESGIRYVALDTIPADLMESIQVTKALTPDMDGDSIGGTVDLVTKKATAGTRASATVGLGYNNIVNNMLQNFNGSFARRTDDGRTGFALSGSFQNTDRGSQNFEVTYDDGELDELELRHYEVNRKRIGVMGNFDHAFGQSSQFFLNGIFTQYDDDERRRRRVDVVGDEEMERELKDRFESQRIFSISGGAEHGFANLMRLDWRLAFSYAQEEEPDRVDTNFIQEGVKFSPNVSPDFIDPNNIQSNPSGEDLNKFLFDELALENNLTKDRITSAAVNLSQYFTGGLWKIGTKLKFRKKERDNNKIEYEADDDLFLKDGLDTGFDPGKFLDGRYNFNPWFIQPDIARGLIPNLEGERDIEEDLADYDGTENTYAGFGMVEVNATEEASILVGARYEYADVTYNSGELILDEDGEIDGISPIEGTNDYGFFLPMIHFRYALGPDSNFRAAVTRSYSRPNFQSLIPTTIINQEDREIERGNPQLKPTHSWNFDLMGEHYFSSTVGVLSGGFFYKHMDDNVFITRSEIEREGRTFEITEPQNLQGGHVVGVEVAYQQPLLFLPSPMDGLGLYFNWTFADSGGKLFGREDLKNRLPGQAESLGNFALSYEKYGFSGRVSLNYHADYLSEVDLDGPEGDAFIDKHFQVDLYLSQRISRQWRVFAEFINLNNEPWRLYIGTPDRPLQEEYYSWWATFGVKWDF
jgi:TonB-dependent receptor